MANKIMNKLNELDKEDLISVCQEIEVPQKIIKFIKKRFPEIRNCVPIRSNQIHLGMNLSLVTLDMNKLLIPGACVKINYRKNNQIDTILMYNNYLKFFWQIRPQKYYLFEINSRSENAMLDLIKNYMKKNKK